MDREGAGEGDSVSHEPSTSKSPKEGEEETTKKVKDDEKTKTVPFYKLFAFADSFDVFLMICGSLGAIGNGVSLPLITLLFGDLIDSFGQNQNNKDIVAVVSKVCLKFVYLAFGTLGAAFLQVACWMITGERQAARIRSTYLKTILRQDIGFFDVETNTGEVVGRMSGDTVLIQDAMGEKVGKFIQLVSTFVGGFVLAFLQGWLLTLIMLTSIPLNAMAGAAMALIVTRTSSRGQASYAKAANVVEQTIGSIRTVASFTGEKQAIKSYKKFITSAYKSSIQQGFSTGLGFGVMFFVYFSSYAFAIWFGGKMILEKGYTGGAVINVIIIVVVGSRSLGQTSPCVTAFAAGQAAAYKMFETIKRKPLIDAYDLNGKVLEDIRGDIELKDVHFSYPARPNEDIFDRFSLFIPSGATTALVGESGSGKSTVISLIERFYDPKAGEVLIDGVNLKEFKLKWIRSKIGLVSQEPVLFSSSIVENIAYGKENVTLQEIKAATELANAANFIAKLPQGLDTMVGEHGTQLSGGQKQRIAIARAIVKDPRILLLDEATSALDAESERVVQEALDKVMVNRTTIIVAHRLSTIRNADMIAVIHRGKLVEKGSHSELLKDSEGAYSQLIQLQEINKGQDAKPSDRPSAEEPVISGGTSSVGNNSSQRVGQAETRTAGKEPVPKVSLTRIAALNKPEIPVLLLGTVAAAINGAIFPLFGILISRVIESFFKPADELKKDSRFWAIIFVALGVTSLIVSPAQMYLFAVAGGKLIRRIRSVCFERVVHMEVGWFDEPQISSGTMGARLSADAALIRALVGDALSLVVQNAASAASGLIIAFTASWELALIILVMLPLIGINGFVQVKLLKGFSVDAKLQYEEASQVANDAVGSIRTVASFCAEEKVMQMYKKQCEGPIKDGIKQGFISGLGSGFSFFILFCVYATSFYAGARLVEDGKTTFNDVFQVMYFPRLVSQEPVLFSSSIMDNIAYGKENATLQEIKAATELANAANFIAKLPQGLDTMVGEHGTQLSGGQKQRIAIARAILKDPRILLLDEATSALDAESERVVQEALDKVMVNRTTIIVAHRLSTIRNADMIAVIHRGKLVEKGSHSELLKDSEGAYSQLIQLQEINKDQDAKPSDISSAEEPVTSGGTSSVGNNLCSCSQQVGQEEIGTISKEPLPKVSLTRIAALNKPEIPFLLLGTVAAAINGAIFPLFGILLSRVIEAFFKPADELKKDSIFWAIIFVALGVISLIVPPTQMYLFAVAGGKLIQRIRSVCFKKAIHMEVGWFDEPNNSSGTIGARLSADAALIRALFGDALSLAVQNAASAASGLIIAFTASWELALIILVMLPLIGINGFVQVKFMKGFSADAKSQYEEASQVANDAVGSIRTVASFCAEEKVMQMYKKQCEGPIKDGIKQGFISGLGSGFSFFILFCVYATSFYAGARLVEDSKATFNDVFQVFFGLSMATVGISQSSSFAQDSSKAKVAAASIFAIIDRQSKIDSSDESGTVLENVKGDIELSHLSFTYPARPDIQIFRDLCLTIRAGKTVALVGESGSGKSTVISLLQRFYDPDSGHITLDGVELKKLQLKWLRQQMGLVGQEPVLFNDTIRANIAYGKGSEDAATESEIIAAAELANAHKFISSIQQGYDTVVGERGIQLSGGQKQRVAIARAIVKEPKILLLDEATSALDAESERVVQDALDRVMVNRTTVVVAHRLSTIKNADVIAVVKNGVIAEKGTHETLIKIDSGVYASLVQLHMTPSI